MQRDNDNSDPNTPTEQQGIFSTPDLSVNSENLEAVMPATATNPDGAEADNKARIAAAFAGTDATSKAEALAAAVQQSTTASTVTEDIQLSGEKKKRSKLPLIIVLAVIVAVAVGGGVWLALSRSGGNQSSSLRKSFNEYANYFLYGTDSDKDIEGLYEYRDMYYLGTLEDEEQINNFFLEAEERYQSFYSAYREFVIKNPDGLADYPKQLAEEYYGNLDLLRCVMQRPNLNATSILAAFLNDPTLVANSVRQYYQPFTTGGTDSTRAFVNEYIGQVDTLLASYNTFYSYGCIDTDDQVIRAGCLQTPENEELSEAANGYIDFYHFYLGVSEATYQLPVTVYENIWAISQELE